MVIMESRENPFEFDFAETPSRCATKLSASSKSSEVVTSVPRRQLQAAGSSSHARESFLGAAPCRDAGVQICRCEVGSDARNKVELENGMDCREKERRW
jgi:hypothetical protein